MTRWLAVIIIFFTSLLLAGCAPSTLAGTVTDIDSGEPIAGATITVGQAQATSDAAGAFEVAIEAWGKVLPVSAAAPGYPTWERVRMFPEGVDRWNVRLSKTGRYR